MQFIDLKEQQKRIHGRIMENISTVLAHGQYILGPEIKEAKIPTAIYYPRPLHVQGAYAYLGYRAEDFPVSMKSAAGIFSLPMHPYLAESDQAMIAEAIQKAYK